jgi:predicted PurR-regulated permease PerM
MPISNLTDPTPKEEYTYIQKVWIAAGSVALLAVLIFVLRGAFNVLLMVLAGSLIAVYFHGWGDIIQRWTKMKRIYCMILSVASTFIILVSLFWFMGAKIQAQIAALSEDLPQIISNAEIKIRQNSIGNKILQNVSGENSSKLISTAQNLFRTSFGALGDLYIIIFLGIFFSASPSVYKDGILKLIPPSSKNTGKQVIDRISLVLKGWLKGMMIAMLLIAVLSTVGLSIIGIPMALALGLIAGLLNFIPNFGPMLAMIPAVLLGLVMGPNTALTVAILYIVIQALESNVITPNIQKKMINIPPALTIISQVIMGTVTGGLGIILATPLLAIVIVLVDELYVKKQKEVVIQP